MFVAQPQEGAASALDTINGRQVNETWVPFVGIACVWMPCNEVLYLTHVVAEDKALRFWILGLAWLWMKRFFSDELIGNVVKVEFQNP